jgi:hypothetical protein
MTTEIVNYRAEEQHQQEEESHNNDGNSMKFVKPVLPPLYFIQDNQICTTNESSRSNSTASLQTLPSEMLTNILSFLNWGDYARVATSNSSFRTLLPDVAKHGGCDSKWTLAVSLLNGMNGLKENPSLAIHYLEDLSGITLPLEEEEEQKDEEKTTTTNTIPQQIQMEPEKEIHTPAMRKLANCYLTSNGVPHNPMKGLEYLNQAFLHGDIDAAYQTATVYEYSKHGVPVDIYKAAEYFKLAAEAGHVEAMAEYAMCCELGCGIEQNDEMALDWYTKAAQRGHVTSNYSVGEMFEEARGGLPQSDAEAVLWYYKAAMMGDEDSIVALKRLGDISRIIVPGWMRTLEESRSLNV